MRPIHSALLMAALATIAWAPVAQSPVAVGETPPTGFALENLDGETVALDAARGDHPVLLVFFRGTW